MAMTTKMPKPLIDTLTQAVLEQLGIGAPEAKPEISREAKLKAVMEHLITEGEFAEADDGTVTYAPAQADSSPSAGDDGVEAGDGDSTKDHAASAPSPDSAIDSDTANLMKLVLGGQAKTAVTAKDIEDEKLGDDDLLSAYDQMLKAETA